MYSMYTCNVRMDIYKSGQGKGEGLAVSGHPFQYGLCMRKEGIKRSFYHYLPVLKIEK